MNPALTQLTLKIFLTVLVASMIGVATYSVWRFLEKQWTAAVSILSWLVVAYMVSVVLAHGNKSPGTSFLPLAYFVIASIICAVGSIFHLKSGGRSTSKYNAFSFLLSVSLLSGFLGIFPDILFFGVLESYDDRVTVAYYASLVIWPSATAFFIYAWQNSKLRPGIDKHL